jgi:hypothetical protein
MADRLLSRATERVGVAGCALVALAAAGCPHDWSSFESVPSDAYAPISSAFPVVRASSHAAVRTRVQLSSRNPKRLLASA